MHAPLRPSFQVEWRGLATLEPIAAEWRAPPPPPPRPQRFFQAALPPAPAAPVPARAPDPTFFYEPAFALAAASVFGADAGAVLVRTGGGRLAGLFPMRIERWRGGLNSMAVGWTHPFAPLGTPLVARDEPEAVIAAWLDHLSRDPAIPAQLLLPLVPEQGAFGKALDAVLACEGRRSAAFGRHERALLAPGAEREGYLVRAMSGGKRKELRRHRRRLEEIAPVTFATTSDAAGIEAALKDFLVLEA